MNPERPLVTFALFAYNQERFIREAVYSALNQDYPSLEIIVSDDFSTDNTYLVAKNILNAYSGPHRVRLIRNNANVGIGAHVQKIFEVASGDIVVMAAGDDVSLNMRVSSTVNAFLSNPSALAFVSAFEYIDTNSKPVPGKWTPPHSTYTMENFSKGIIHCPGAACAWNRRLVLNWPSLEKVVHEDRVFPFRALLMGGVIAASDETLVLYRASGGISRYSKTESRSVPVAVRESSLRRIRPDALMRLHDFNHAKNIISNTAKVDYFLSRTLFLIDYELFAITKTNLALDMAYFILLLANRFESHLLRTYIKIRLSLIISRLTKTVNRFS